MARYARGVRAAVQIELDALKQRKARQADLSLLRTARRWLHRDADKVPAQAQGQLAQARAAHRSEEHTSELQSQSNLVCRLLLEKKKKKHKKHKSRERLN